MPTYNFLNVETGEEFEALMKISERETFLKENPHIQSVIMAPAIVGGVSIKDKIPDGFKEVLSKVAESHKGSPIGEKHYKFSVKEVKTKKVIDDLYKKKYEK
jgi:hypothetical protein